MDKLPEFLARLGYDIVGILVPAVYTAFFVALAVYPMSSSHPEIGPRDFIADGLALVAGVAMRTVLEQFGLLGMALVLGHAVGQTLKTLSSGAITKIRNYVGRRVRAMVPACLSRQVHERAGRIAEKCVDFLLAPFNAKRLYHSEGIVGVATLATRLTANQARPFGFVADIEATLSPADKWGAYFRVARAHIQARKFATLSYSFQNKYTMYRSLVTASAGGMYCAAVSLLVMCWQHFGYSLTQQTHVVWSGGALVGLCLLNHAFRDEFGKYFVAFGDTLAAEHLALALTAQKMEPDDGDGF